MWTISNYANYSNTCQLIHDCLFSGISFSEIRSFFLRCYYSFHSRHQVSYYYIISYNIICSIIIFSYYRKRKFELLFKFKYDISLEETVEYKELKKYCTHNFVIIINLQSLGERWRRIKMIHIYVIYIYTYIV